MPASAAPVSPSVDWQSVVDGASDDFVRSLPDDARQDARELPLTLRLTPRPLPWSRIFHQEVTLGLPLTLSEALPGVSPAATRAAVTAHMLGIVAAFGADRLDDGQVEATPRLVRVLDLVRAARDAALDSFGVHGAGPVYDYRASEVATRAGNQAEQAFLAANRSASFATYDRLTRAKQFLVFPAAMTFARAAGLGEEALERLERMCLAMAMGLQLRDDATDWEDDHAEGRSWAVRLLRQAEAEASDDGDLEGLRGRLAEAGLVVKLLDEATRYFEEASDCARALSAGRIAAWSDKQAAVTRELARGEREKPGHIVRWEIARKQARMAVAV